MTEEREPHTDPSYVRDAVKQMMANGYLLLERVIDPQLISDARQAFFERYDRYLQEQDHSDALTVGTRRYMVTVQIEPPFDQEELLGNAALLPILRSLLGSDCLLSSFGVVCSLPHAPAQPMHRDGGGLFSETPLDALLPPYAVTVAVPLIEMNEHHGTTALYPGSHRSCSSLPSFPPLIPRVREGDFLMWDYRLAHHGTANVSEVSRPLLYLTYCRPWFFDRLNFSEQAPLVVEGSAYEKFSLVARGLIDRLALARKPS